MKVNIQCLMTLAAFITLSHLSNPLFARVSPPLPTGGLLCTPPATLALSGISSIFAEFEFSSVPGLVSYQWEIGPQGFTPGTGAALYGNSTLDTTFSVSGLTSNTFFHVYVRTNCGGEGYSDWTGPLQFRTLPGCGDSYFDTGGLFEGYNNNQSYEQVICADSATQVVTMTFASFHLIAGDTLRIFNGSSNAAPLMGAFTGTATPGPFTATTASGCLTMQFISDASGIGLGWEAAISCGRPDSCFSVLRPEMFEVFPFFNRAGFRWDPMFNARKYEWRAGVKPYSPSQPTTLKDSTFFRQVVVTGLTEATYYDFWVRTICKNGDSSGWVKVPFFTPPNCNSGVLNCGNSTWVFSSIGTGIYQSPICAIPTPGKEKIIRFVAPHTRRYKFHVETTSGNTNVGYFYKPVSLGCGPEDWQCIGVLNHPDSILFGPLIAGQEYFIRFESQNPAILVSHTISIDGCGVANDNAWTAQPLVVDAACSNNIYSTDGAAPFLYEPEPDVDPSDELVGRWNSKVTHSVWFKFVAPLSGTVQISTQINAQTPVFDTKIALYYAPDPTDYLRFLLLESDDDSGGDNAAKLTFTGLAPGQTYYIQVDGLGPSPGTFCIQVLDFGPRTLQNNCDPGYAIGGVDGTLPGGNHWYNIYTVPATHEVGEIIAALKPGPQNLDTVWCQLNNLETIPVAGNGVAYMPAYFNFRSKKEPKGPVTLRLFFYDTEFDALKTAANDPGATIEDLNATHFTGRFQDCELAGNEYGPGDTTLITAVDGVPCGTSGTFYVELEIDSMGEVGVHLGRTALPLELRSFSGKVDGNINLLEWETLTEQRVRWHIVERSADNTHWGDIGQLASAGDSKEPVRYSWVDSKPPARAYYRLRSVDWDGRSAYSHSILLNRPDETFGITSVFPSPTNDDLTVQYTSGQEDEVELRVMDFTGRIVLEKHSEASKGLNQTSLSLNNLPAGAYVITVANSSEVTAAVRAIKK